MLAIDGTELPLPTKYDVGISDLDSSDTFRNENGVLTRNRVRQGVTKISVGFTVRGSQTASILKLLEPAEVSVTYFDPRTSVTRTIQAYVGDRSCTLKLYLPEMTIENMLWDISFSLVEY